MTTLVTGAAGFIGFHVSQALLARGEHVIGIDNLNSYYDVALKHARLSHLENDRFTFENIDVADRSAVESLTSRFPKITRIVHLAAQAGVRYSMIDPYAYVTSNVMGHLVLLEAARRLDNLDHFVFASSSSVYGLNSTLPFHEEARADAPSSLYAATKRADELMSYSYAHLYGIRQTGLRFFTVYGPWGRPDMAYYSFAAAIASGKPITVYEGGTLKRDFTYIDDITSGVLEAANQIPPENARLRLLNIGNNRSEPVTRLIALLEQELGRKAVIETAPAPAADVHETWASIDEISHLTNFQPSTPLGVGIPRFASWFKDYHRID